MRISNAEAHRATRWESGSNVLRSYQKKTTTQPTRLKVQGDTKMDIDNELFESAAEAVKTLDQRPDDRTMLQLYALYKQGSLGDVTGDKPGFFDFVGAAKYEAWEKLRGTSQEDARTAYVELVRKLGAEF